MSPTAWVKESVFGIWFLNTDMWFERVLKRAIADLDRMLPEPKKRYPLILDVGCGRGNSFGLLEEYFNPDQISGIEFMTNKGRLSHHNLWLLFETICRTLKPS